ncbi:MAG: SMP-30/gluconolactonase/LRE family protein [Bradymonadia bacterium]
MRLRSTALLLGLAACDESASTPLEWIDAVVPTNDATPLPLDTSVTPDGAPTPLLDLGGPQDARTDAADAATPPPDAAAPVFPLEYPVPETCWDDLAPGTAVIFAEGFDAFAEGISFGPNGGLYVSVPGENSVVRVMPDGTHIPFAEVPDALGMAPLLDGRLVVAQIGASIVPEDIDGGVWIVDAAGLTTSIATGIASPNFVVVLPNGDLLVSDDFDTRIWRVTLEGEVSVAIPDFPSPNGMALDPLKQRLYVVSTFSPNGDVAAYDLGPDALPVVESRRTLHQLGPGRTLDGLAVDQYDQLYVAANLRGQILRLKSDGTGMPIVVADDLITPASLAFGRAPDFDPCSLYVTELRGTRLWRIAVGAEGASVP